MKIWNARYRARVMTAMLALIGLWAATAQANLILNGDFETGDFTDWTLFTTPNGSLGPAPVPDVVPFDVTGTGATEAAEFQVGQIVFTLDVQEGGGIRQTIVTSAGTVAIHADIAVLNTSGSENAEGGVFTLFLDSVPVDSFAVGDILNGVTVRSTLDFTGPINAGNHDLAILITRPYEHGGGVGVTPLEYVDNISLDVAAVPEPGTIALFSLSLFGIGVARRWRAGRVSHDTTSPEPQSFSAPGSRACHLLASLGNPV